MENRAKSQIGMDSDGKAPCKTHGELSERQELPNRDTIAAMLEAERMARDPSVKRYTDVEEALRELNR